MTVFEKHVFLKICEISLTLLHKSIYVTYHGYCRGMSNGIKDKSLTRLMNGDLIVIIDRLKFIFGFDDATALKYVTLFFGSNAVLNFERAVRLTKDAYRY
jgi:hypothetical protein